MNHYTYYELYNYLTTAESKEETRLKKMKENRDKMIERNKHNSEKFARR